MATAGIWPVCCHPFFAGFRRVCRPVPCLIDSRSFQHQATRHRCMEGSRRVRALKKGRRSAPAWRRNCTSYFIIPSKRRWLTSFSCPVRSPFPATKTTRYWEEHETYHYWRNPSTTENGLGLTTDSGCVSFHLCGSSCNSSSYDAFVRFLSSSLCLCISLKSVAKQ